MRPALDATGLGVGWDGRTVVSGITVRVEPGTTLALIGSNGSGKSTLLRTLVGLQPPLAGSVTVAGAAPGRAPTRVAYVAQFHPHATILPLRVRDVVAMGRYPHLGHLGWPSREDREAVEDAMERMDVADLAGRPLRDLSGGQRQRTYVAQALARRAELLLLDEPTSGLDVGAIERLVRVMDGERDRGVAVVHATHDVADAMRADQAMLLAGRVVAVGSPSQVVTRDAVIATFGLQLSDLSDGTPIAMDPGHAHGHHDPHDHSHR